MSFAQYNIQIYSLTITSLLTIIIAFFPNQVVLDRKKKICVVFSIYLINLMQMFAIIVDFYFRNRLDYNGIASFVSETEMWNFVKCYLASSTLGAVIMALFCHFVKRNDFTDKQLMRYYVDLTKKQNPRKSITIIGGSMDFLGTAPCSQSEEGKKCKNAVCGKGVKTYLRKCRLDNKCRNCSLNNPQWKQMKGLVDKGCNIQIVCCDPANTSNNRESERLFGFLLKSRRKEKSRRSDNDSISISFYGPDKDFNIRGRIIEDMEGMHHVCWNFKTSNDNHGKYETPHIYTEADRMGKIVILAFKDICNSAVPLGKNKEKKYIDAFTQNLKSNDISVNQVEETINSRDTEIVEGKSNGEQKRD